MLENQNDLSTIKLIDFGLSVKYDDTSFLNMLNDRWGTLIYMAPEIIQYKDYNKSVDLWSVGILMYMLISDGDHPFYKPGMDSKTYIKLLQTSPELKFDESKFSKIAIDLISKMLNFETIHRYNTDQALKHPWITRWNESIIPITYNDVLKNFEIEDKLRRCLKAVFVCSVVKVQNSENDTVDEKYKALCNKVTNAIDKWHREIKKTDFVNDEDFVEHQGSPNKFDTTSDFSRAFDNCQGNLTSDKQSLATSCSRALSPNQSDRDDLSPNSDISYNIINPIKIWEKNEESSDANFSENKRSFIDGTKESDKTTDIVKEIVTNSKNTQRNHSKSLMSKNKVSYRNFLSHFVWYIKTFKIAFKW